MNSLPLPPVLFLSSVGPGGESVYSYVLDELTGNREVSVLLSKGVITSGPKPRADSLVWKVQAGWQVWAESQRESVSSEPAASGGQLVPVSPCQYLISQHNYGDINTEHSGEVSEAQLAFSE